MRNANFCALRESWARYFTSVGLPVAFWSAQQESERLVSALMTFLVGIV